MKTSFIYVFAAAIFTALASPPIATAQSNSAADIFADLLSIEPGPSTDSVTQPVVPPAASQPAPEAVAAPVTVQPSAQETPVLYTANSDDMPVVSNPAPSEETPVNIDQALSLGKDAYVDGDLNKAQKLFEFVLHADAYNKEAIRWLQRIANKKAGREEKSYDTTRSRMLETVQAAWNTPKAEGEKPDRPVEPRELTRAEKQAITLRDKLANIRIPVISFQDADIQQVVLELSALCRKLDPEHKGANLVVFGTSGYALPLITFSGTDLSALETLDIITQISGMKYEIGPNMVSLTPVNYEAPQQMVTTEFDIVPSVGRKMTAHSGTQPGELLDVHNFFSTVPFPPGASAQYNPEFNVLLVRNVPQHIEKITGLLNRYNRKAEEERSRQVEIETKFIEVSQGALDELGFNWTLGAAGTTLTSGNYGMPGGQQLFADTLRTGQDAFDTGVGTAGRATSFNSYAGTVADPTGTGLVGTAGELLVQKIKGTPVDVVIRALERTAGSDLLSAPKVLTKSGETAAIHVGETHWYPTAFDVSIERYSQPSLVPLDYQEEKTGVMLEVTPELDPENGTINMKLSPEIRELAGFDEQHVGTIWPEYGNETLDMNSDTPANNNLIDFLTLREQSRTASADRLIARRPIFKSRKVNTSVTIEDGSTIAMGGLIKEQMETYKDSVPILGKIPIIGRLFRSEGEKSVKRNLLIFVTANQVDASGYKKAAL